MTRFKIEWLIWDQYNQEHIKKHNVSLDEVIEALGNVYSNAEGKKGRIILIGRCSQRVISVIIAQRLDGYYVVTARDASKKERNLLYEKEEE